jgi:uncharacterized protein (DUF362 family)
VNHGFSRREILTAGLGATGWLLTGGLTKVPAGEPSAKSAEMPDRSGQAPCPPVAIQQCTSYEPKGLRQRLDRALELIGGIKDLVSGKTVTMKMNVTGGPGSLCGLPGFRTYQVHPNLVAAICAALYDAGARRIVLVESQYSPKSPEEVLHEGGWDIRAIQSAGGQRVSFEDTRNRGRWPAYSKLSVPWGGFIFPAFHLNPRYEKTDVFVSLAKLKDHGSAGVTMAVKNLFGIAPTALYGNDAPNENTLSNRGDILHNGKRTVPAGVPAENDHRLPADWRRRVPRVTADLLGARPVDLAVVDGIECNRGGEGPWMTSVEPIRPGLLLAGRNAVTTDAIATAAMGYNPQAAHGEFPFPGDNHLLLLSQVGVGAIDPRRIEICGVPLAKALCPYNPKRISLPPPTTWYCHPPRDPVVQA